MEKGFGRRGLSKYSHYGSSVTIRIKVTGRSAQVMEATLPCLISADGATLDIFLQYAAEQMLGCVLNGQKHTLLAGVGSWTFCPRRRLLRLKMCRVAALTLQG